MSKDRHSYLSPNVNILPSENEIAKNDLQMPSANSGNGVASGTTPNINRAPSSDIVHSLFCPSRSTLTSEMMEEFGSVRNIDAGEPCAVVPLKADNCNCEFIFRQASKIQKATWAEISFIHLTYLVGRENAEKLAEELGLVGIISPPDPPPSTGDPSTPAPSPGNDAIEVVPANGDLPPILLTGYQPKSHHPLAETWHDHIRQPLLNARPSLPSVLAAFYRATLRVHRRFLCHRPRVEFVCRMCRCIQAFLWWAYKTVS